MFKITEQWLEDHRTQKGGWTWRQAEVLGTHIWKNPGWKARLVGQWISAEQKKDFEDSKTIFHPGRRARKAGKATGDLFATPSVYRPGKQADFNATRDPTWTPDRDSFPLSGAKAR